MQDVMWRSEAQSMNEEIEAVIDGCVTRLSPTIKG